MLSSDPKISSYVALSPRPKRAQKRQNGRFYGVKSHFAWRKSATKFLVWKLSARKLQDIHWPNYPCKNDW